MPKLLVLYAGIHGQTEKIPARICEMLGDPLAAAAMGRGHTSTRARPS